MCVCVSVSVCVWDCEEERENILKCKEPFRICKNLTVCSLSLCKFCPHFLQLWSVSGVRARMCVCSSFVLSERRILPRFREFPSFVSRFPRKKIQSSAGKKIC